MICIRIFATRKEAKLAQKILSDGGIVAIITEDKFNGVPIQKYGVSARFRLKVEDKDFPRTAKFLKSRLKI